ncbi:helix-turn-helix domain-containing protein [Caulobacter sp. NIBR2454]|uniref:helix-turn-helix domain-containing protein n=1 Tax=Caulobacter sp. NIBR2454 TaxID=3015996 RepID=UPI0022B68078|nr:helix-turn-helix transcriptional regulator [Caulobacter sp. NIBR2454]
MASSVFTEDYRELLAILVEARVASGLSQEKVGAKLGKPQSFVSKSENGERRVDVAEFCNLAEAMGRSPVELFDEFLKRRKGA